MVSGVIGGLGNWWIGGFLICLLIPNPTSEFLDSSTVQRLDVSTLRGAQNSKKRPALSNESSSVKR